MNIFNTKINVTEIKKYSTFFSDLHEIEMSIKTSELLLDAYCIERASAIKQERVKYDLASIEGKIQSQQRLITAQRNIRDQMIDIITTFPKDFRTIYNIVYEERFLKNKTISKVAAEQGYTEQYIRMISSEIMDKFYSHMLAKMKARRRPSA